MDGYHTIVHVLRTPVVLTLAMMGVIRLVPICTATGLELGYLRTQPAIVSLDITKTSLFKYTENFTTKNENFR